jgi:hypothetical protein
LKKQRAKNYDGSDDDWNNIVSSLLDPTTALSTSSQQKDNLDVTCSISGKGAKRTLSIAFSNKVEEITQRLGTIELSETEDTENVELFDWASQAIEQRDTTQDEAIALRRQVQTKDDIISSLQKQIDELVEAKAEHEKQMLSKFTLLLNEKKLKIRNMQRILATANPDRKKLKQIEAVIRNEPATLATRNKRPANDEAQEDDEDDSDAFETMGIDADLNVEKDPDSPVSANTTPSASEAEDTEEETSAPAVSSNPPRKSVQALSKQKESVKQSSQPTPATIDDDNDETASEDSEL